MGKFQDLTGRQFGHWTVLERADNIGEKVAWRCRCDCLKRTERIVLGGSLKSGKSTSCGCVHKEQMMGNKLGTKHGQRHTKLYEVWLSMKQRCSNPKSQYYRLYGGKGVTVCKEWKNFVSFYEWAISNGYKDGLTIERKDSTKGYNPYNCKWATKKEQANNTERNHYITYNGETHTMAQWAEITGMTYETIRKRIKRGWPVERALKK